MKKTVVEESNLRLHYPESRGGGWVVKTSSTRANAAFVTALTLISTALAGCPFTLISPYEPATEDIAQEWNTLLRAVFFEVDQGPTVEARNFFHFSAAMFDAWAAYDETATGYFTGSRLKQPAHRHSPANRAEALSHAVYEIAIDRFGALASLPSGNPARTAFEALEAKMERHGYLDDDYATDARDVGRAIAETVERFASDDGANQANEYADPLGYVSVNAPIFSNQPGTNGMAFPNDWQEVVLPDGSIQEYLTPHWGTVTPFALPPFDPDSLRIDPGPPSLFGTETNQDFVETFTEVLRFSSMLDPFAGAGQDVVNLSPRVRGVDTPGDWTSEGHAINPYTGAPYADHLVKLGDYLRVVAVQHDGLVYGTPAPWWNEVLTNVLRGEGVVAQRPANKRRSRDLEYDVKAYFAMNATLHDAAIAVWDSKLVYNSCRPISALRYLAENDFMPIEPGFVERILPGDPLAGPNDENVGEIKVFAWSGPNRGVDWILGSTWHPYLDENFVTPPFPGYVSGHTAMSRAGAEVMTAITGDPYFPGGLAELRVESLDFEDGPSEPVLLQWATFVDMADETALGRILCGAHITEDILPAKTIGAQIASTALDLAYAYFDGRGVAVGKIDS